MTALLEARDMTTGRIVVSSEGNQPYINILFFDSVLPDSRGKPPVVLGRSGDLREGDVLIYPVRPGDTTTGSLYAVRPYRSR